jgi:hypothetical protein
VTSDSCSGAHHAAIDSRRRRRALHRWGSQIDAAEPEQVERDVRGRRAGDQWPCLGRRGDEPVLQGVERQPSVDEDHVDDIDSMAPAIEEPTVPRSSRNDSEQPSNVAD